MTNLSKPEQVFVGQLIYISVEILHTGIITDLPAQIVDIRGENGKATKIEVRLFNDNSVIWLPVDRIYEKVELRGNRPVVAKII